MTSKLALQAALAAGWIMLSGCAALVVGAGAGAGAYTYVNGELVRTYEANYSHVMEVCALILKDLNMPIRSQTSDRDQTSIETQRHDGTPVTLRIRIVGLNLTQVTVRTGVVGYWNRDSSQQFQEFIAQRIRTSPGSAEAPDSAPRFPFPGIG